MKIIYLSTGVLDNAFDSQVLAPMKYLNEIFPVQHIAFEPRQNWSVESRFKKVNNVSKEINTISIKCMKFIGRGSLYIDSYYFKKLFSFDSNESVVVHSRSAVNALRFYNYSKRYNIDTSIITDFRGLLSDEVLYARNSITRTIFNKYISREISRIEKKATQVSNKILTVSNNLKQYLIENYNADHSKIFVIPAVVDEEKFRFNSTLRKNIRESLLVQNRLVILYSGGISGWQPINEIIELFLRLKKIYPEVFLLFITKEKLLIRKKLEDRLNSDDWQLLSASYNDIGKYYAASDIGLLLRKRRLTNTVASPIKFSEYLCAGLPVILTKGVGDTENYIEKFGVGEVLESTNDTPSDIMNLYLSDLNREKLSKRAINIFGIKENYNNIIKLVYH